MSHFKDLLIGNGITAVIYQKFLMKAGQVSTDLIFDSEMFSNDIAYNENKVFLRIFKPLLDVSDCFIRIKNIKNPEFNFVFIIHQSALVDSINLMEENPQYSHFIESVADPDLLPSFKEDILNGNYQQVKRMLANKNEKINADEELNNTMELLKEKRPFKKKNITLDLFNISRILVPNFEGYFEDIFHQASADIQQERNLHKQKVDYLSRIVEDEVLYWNSYDKKIVSYKELFILLKERCGVGLDINISDNDINDWLRDNCIIFEVSELQPEQNVKHKFNNFQYEFIYSGSSMQIRENGRDIKILTHKKTEFFEKIIRDFIFPEIQIEMGGIKEANTFALYKKKSQEIVESIMATKNYTSLCITRELFRQDCLFEIKATYESLVYALIKAVCEIKTEETILRFVKGYSQKTNFIFRLISNFLSSWNESEVNNGINEKKKKIQKVSKDFENMKSIASTPSNFTKVDPIQAAVDIIKSDYSRDNLLPILNSKTKAVNEKAEQILAMYADQIGRTNKAIIIKNDEQMKEFVKRLKETVDIEIEEKQG